MSTPFTFAPREPRATVRVSGSPGPSSAEDGDASTGADSAYSTRRSTFAGAPAAMEYGGMSWVTTLFAPITLRSPTVTPLVTTTFAPHQTLSPMRVGPLLVNPCHVIGLSGSSKRWLASVTKQPFANMQ